MWRRCGTHFPLSGRHQLPTVVFQVVDLLLALPVEPETLKAVYKRHVITPMYHRAREVDE